MKSTKPEPYLNNPTKAKESLSYRDAGVDIDAGNELVERIKPAVKSTLRPEVLTGLGGFGALFSMDLDRWKEPLLVSGTDGVGTKLMLARQLGRHDTIGIDLVAMCVNDILTCGAEPLFFLDYFATGKLELDEAQRVIEGIAEGCRQSGCALIGGETAEMPGMYGAGEYDLAGFSVGAVERSELLDGSKIRAGHRVLGMASSGPHSNGYSLIRKVVERSGSDLDATLCTRAGEAVTIGSALLAPTRIYVKPVLELLRNGQIDGLAHITGGGLTENIVRVLPDGLGIDIDTNSWPRPEVFDWLQQQGAIEATEMLRTFNCGIGMVMLVPEQEAADVSTQTAERGIPCFDIGAVVAVEADSRVRYRQ
ncbi:MAG: phosphoribosylformylglycinamidine cyclo-ligase [Xanthomonadales bacterium]|nr:phosphoribosylformylglycinamidine cyclo-ligase [Gammaproteobacteria bacterium]MBT8053049.1 phosphoribosylformylglycinamidine cyclo-ligase [Gammaproteobacteria bacterium]NND56707.1 phosphoribosylformylglycinamidine cyclo-ligase [Xanthomonadales bacterium]NNK52692.1 phosphoribosylformylglycinamidine cyclo-ligase [Xanthomonadales bacterium]